VQFWDCLSALRNPVKADEKRRLKELEVENLRLKKMFAELQLKHEVMSEAVIILKKMQAQRMVQNL